MKRSNSQQELIISNAYKRLKEDRRRNEIVELEAQLFQKENPESEFLQDDCFINEHEYVHYVQYKSSQALPWLVMLHGYGGGSYTFF